MLIVGETTSALRSKAMKCLAGVIDADSQVLLMVSCIRFDRMTFEWLIIKANSRGWNSELSHRLRYVVHIDCIMLLLVLQFITVNAVCVA